MGLTTDPNDPALGRGAGGEGMNAKYLVLSDDERRKGFVRPVRLSYVHAEELGGCGAITSMHESIAETYAHQPHFYGATFCVRCNTHLPVGEDGEFYWVDNDGQETTLKVGT